MRMPGQELERRRATRAAGGIGPTVRQGPEDHPSPGRSASALRRARAQLRRRPLALGLRLAAGLEGLAAVRSRDTRARHRAVGEPADWDTVRLATGASLLAAAGRPHLRVGTLVTATLWHSLRTIALTFRRESPRGRERQALLELAMSAALGALLRQAARAARWNR